ncbi:MAG TPA: hypothetical protein VJZ27_12600, partial [Aggregatilineales bacterium]|nr:hypothetical protein [Aggregatilineales bacterium]
MKSVLLVFLMCYIIAGLTIAPFHGDEADHLYMARDYVTYFVIGAPERLRVDPPVAIDSEAHIRLLGGTLSAYLTGLLLWQSGYRDLENWHPLWYYPDDVATNRAAGRYPAFDVLWRGRFASAFLTGGCVWLLAAL